MTLTDEKFKNIVKSGKLQIDGTISFYHDAEYDQALGISTVIYDQEVPTGFHDRYNFDSKS